MSRPYSWSDYCLRDGTCETLHAKCGDDDYYFEVLYNADNAKLGIWLSNIPRTVLLEAVKFIFRTHSEVRRIGYRYSRVPLGVYTRTNHFRIELPGTQDEILARMSKHERKKLNNRQRRLNEAGNITLHDYKADWNNPESVEAVNKFFEFKKITHGKNYNLTPKEYIQVYQVSDIYALRCDGEIIAVKLSCKQCPIVGGENTSYSIDYAKFYLGIIMQYTLLSELTKKGKAELYLGDSSYTGQRTYKQHFNSIEETAYNGIIYRSFTEHIRRKAAHAFRMFIKALLPWKLVAVIRSVKRGTKLKYSL